MAPRPVLPPAWTSVAPEKGFPTMAHVSAFRGLRYNQAKVDIARVVAPPYDVISDELRARLCARDPHNVVRLTLGPEPLGDDPPESRYEQAARDLEEWLERHVLVAESDPALYVYEQEYVAPNHDGPKRRRGVIASVRLHDYHEGVVLPHEGTLARPKADRLRLMEATQCALSPIFAIYSDPSESAKEALDALVAGHASFEVTDDEGVAHRLWVATDTGAIEHFEQSMSDKVVVIADGHHRYETALAYRDAMRSRYGFRPGAPWERVLMFLCNVAAADVTILPCHRLVREVQSEVLNSLERRAGRAFAVKRVPLPPRGPARLAAVKALLDEMSARGDGEHVFAAYWGADHALELTIRDLDALEASGACPEGPLRDLDVALLHCALIEGLLGLQGSRAASGENVFFTRDPREAVESVDAGKSAVVLFVNPTRVDQVIRLAGSGHKMPQKGTYFWPKLLTGTVMYDLRQ